MHWLGQPVAPEPVAVKMRRRVTLGVVPVSGTGPNGSALPMTATVTLTLAVHVPFVAV